MAKEIDKIIQSKTAPKSNNVLWDDGENLKINRNGKWESTGAPMINITYANLVELRNNNKLTAGMQYRIIDYETTTAQENTRSAEHQFDVIVTADNENTLNEVARTCLHDGDTYFSEHGAKLEAWQIWYSLDNNVERFAWADAENGKGVIYRMIDEWNNDIPYDFKNIVFVDMSKSKISAEAYYHANWWAGTLVRDSSADKQTGPHSIYYAWILTNVSGPSSLGVWYTDSNSIQSVDTIFYEYDGVEFRVSETIRITNLILGQMQHTFGYAFSSYNEPSESVDYTVCTKNCYANVIKPMFFLAGIQELNVNTFGNNCYHNSFDNNCHSNTFGDNCYYNSFGKACIGNTFDINCFHNTFKYNCSSNTFNGGCICNTFSNNCSNNSFAGNCMHNSFGANCQDNAFDVGCSNNSLVSSCCKIYFGNRCNYNNFSANLTNERLSEETSYKTVSTNSNGDVKVFNIADLADLLNS